MSDLQATREHCAYCFDTLIGRLQLNPVREATFADSAWYAYTRNAVLIGNPALLSYQSTGALSRCSPSPLFVTWKKQSSARHEPSLRGCIGTFKDLNLRQGIPSFALKRLV
jgi:hypothetical protein